MPEKKQVGIWIRVSTDMQVREESPEHHEKRARLYAEHKEWDVAEVYRLEAVSGKTVMAHPETKRMLADIKRGHITALVFSKLARLARNTRELLEFSELFRASNADLISLSESIDTSSSAGRLFYTMIAAMADWERQEIAERVSASVPIRAKLGKSLGGQSVYGYKWVGHDFVIDEKEGTIRRLIYELFLEHQRQHRVAQELNNRGLRTRNGSKFTATTVLRLLRDTTAKGVRIANYTKSVSKNGQWQVKPQEEWITMPCKAVVSEEVWTSCNQILDTQTKKRTNTGPKAVYLLTGFVHCSCGNKMLIHHHSKKYACKACNVRISVEDMDGIYQEYLKEYLNSFDSAQYIARFNEQLQEKTALLATLQKDRQKLAKRITELVAMRTDGELNKAQFAEQYRPLEERITQLDGSMPELEAEIDFLSVQLYSTDTVIQETKALYDRWADMPFDQQRLTVETITKRIEINREDITITLAYAPINSLNAKDISRHHMGSYLPPT
ncbi:recombinase family protein [Mucilaginibacter sp. HD30]